MMALFHNAYVKVRWNSSAEFGSQTCGMVPNLMIRHDTKFDDTCKSLANTHFLNSVFSFISSVPPREVVR